MNDKRVSGWLRDGHCAFRMILGGDIHDSKDRVAFQEVAALCHFS